VQRYGIIHHRDVHIRILYGGNVNITCYKLTRFGLFNPKNSCGFNKKYSSFDLFVEVVFLGRLSIII
jgi:hypothetical protein